MGRKKLDLTEKRTYKSKLRFNKSDFSFLKEMHEMYEKQDFAVFLRNLLLRNASRIVLTPEVDINTFEDVQKVGSQLNQIARGLNKKHSSLDHEELEKTMQEINNSLKKIKENLK